MIQIQWLIDDKQIVHLIYKIETGKGKDLFSTLCQFISSGKWQFLHFWDVVCPLEQHMHCSQVWLDEGIQHQCFRNNLRILESLECQKLAFLIQICIRLTMCLLNCLEKQPPIRFLDGSAFCFRVVCKQLHLFHCSINVMDFRVDWLCSARHCFQCLWQYGMKSAAFLSEGKLALCRFIIMMSWVVWNLRRTSDTRNQNESELSHSKPQTT